MALQLLRRTHFSLHRASLRPLFDPGIQKPVKGSHLLLQSSSFHNGPLHLDEATKTDGCSEDLTSMESADNCLSPDDSENLDANMSESTSTVHETAEHNDCIEGTKPDQTVENRKAITAASQGIFKAILLGEAGYPPSQKILKNGATVTIFSLGTSGMRNNRKPFENETPDQYARRSLVQWHRIAIYQFQLGALAMKSIKKGSHVYVEGNIETRLFLDPESSSIKRIQEIAVRQNGRVMFLDQNKAKS